MRVRYPLAFAAATATILACIPHPHEDFEDFGKRAAAFAPSTDGGGGSFEASAPPTEAVRGTYYGACLSQLAFGQLNDVFNFWTETNFEPDPAGGGKLSIALQALKLSETTGGPPETVSSAGFVGDKKEATASAPNVAAADGRYSLELGTVNIPGAANPITGRDVVIEQVKLEGFFGKERFCARLNGNVTVPVPLTLEPEKNICQFVPVKDGDPTPTLTRDDFLPGSCPF
jgi:hypothetical protein